MEHFTWIPSVPGTEGREMAINDFVIFLILAHADPYQARRLIRKTTRTMPNTPGPKFPFKPLPLPSTSP